MLPSPFCLLKCRSCNFMRQFRMLITQKVNRHLGFPLCYATYFLLFLLAFHLIFLLALPSPFFFFYYYYGVWSELFNWRWIYALARSYYICASVNSGSERGGREEEGVRVAGVCVAFPSIQRGANGMPYLTNHATNFRGAERERQSSYLFMVKETCWKALK